MDIYVVQPGDDINMIANLYGVSVSSIIQYNELNNPYDLVPGQTIVLVHPQRTHTVKEGDTLGEIASTYGIDFMQLLRYNPYLADRSNIYPGEVLIISYDTNRDITTNGFTYPYINRETLIKTLPLLTYISVFNYRVTAEGGIESYYDDTQVISTALDYGTIPLMMTTTLTEHGQPNLTIAIEILINSTFQDNLIDNLLKTIKSKGYYGVNMGINYINNSIIDLYNNFISKVANRIKSEGYSFFITINPPLKYTKSGVIFERKDCSTIGKVVDGISFTHFIWGTNMDPPGPVSSISNFEQFLDYMVTLVQPDKIRIGIPVVGYDWALPYVEGQSAARSLTLHSAVDQAYDVGAEIEFDEPSQTPFYEYSQLGFGTEVEHVVWFIDARSINSLDGLISRYGLSGKGIWNIMVFYAQMWLVVNSNFNIIKLIPDNL